MTCESARESAAVALLTGEPWDPEVEAHLADCPDCLAEVEALRPLPALLAIAPADVDELLAAPPPGDAMLQRLLAAAAAERRARSWRTRVVAVAAALLVIAVPVGAWVGTHRAEPARVDTTVSNASTGVTGRVQLVPSDWGSQLTMSISGVEHDTRCTLVVVTHEGARQTAATWEASYAGTARVTGTVAASVDDIARVDVVDDSDGTVLLQVPVTT